jgi:hypothetical protein
MNKTVARCSTIAGKASGDAFSSSNVAAPTRNGNSSNPPSPNVNASGGLPVKRSSAVARGVGRGQQSHAARTSR